MAGNSFDIDIDFYDRTQALNVFDHIVASRNDNGELKNHNTGIYVTSIPLDHVNNRASIDYLEAEERGYFKIDFLNVGVYKGVRDEEHLLKLMNTVPLWELLEDPDFCNLLFHVNGHSGILQEMKPRSVDQLAAVLAMIRPAKRHLIGKSWNDVFAEVWTIPENDDYYFKKAHGYAYAVAIVVQMNLICEELAQN